MAYRQKQAVSKPLLIVLLVVVVIGAIMFAKNMGAPAEDENNIPGVPTVPKDFKMPTPDPNNPSPTRGGG